MPKHFNLIFNCGTQPIWNLHDPKMKSLLNEFNCVENMKDFNLYISQYSPNIQYNKRDLTKLPTISNFYEFYNLIKIKKIVYLLELCDLNRRIFIYNDNIAIEPHNFILRTRSFSIIHSRTIYSKISSDRIIEITLNDRILNDPKKLQLIENQIMLNYIKDL